MEVVREDIQKKKAEKETVTVCFNLASVYQLVTFCELSSLSVFFLFVCNFLCYQETKMSIKFALK